METKFTSKKKVWLFIFSVVTAMVLIGLYQIVIYGVNHDIQSKNEQRHQYQIAAKWDIIEGLIHQSIRDANDNLSNKVVPGIVKALEDTYLDQEILRSDMYKLQDVTYDNPVAKIFAESIKDSYLNGIHTDSNNAFAIVRNIGVVTDLSPSTAIDENTTRPVAKEIQSHYNEKLAISAFDTIMNQKYQTAPIFWQYYEPNDMSLPDVNVMKLSELQKRFEASNGDIESLRSFTFLVPKYIFEDKDILGTPNVSDRGIRQVNYQIIVVQKFNIAEIVDYYKFDDDIFNSKQVQPITSVFQLNAMYQFLIFIGLTFVIFFGRSVMNVKYRIYNTKK